MRVRMNCANGERRFGSASMIALAAVLGCAAMPAQAQPSLAITEAQSGFFRGGSDLVPPTSLCSNFSPQFSNALAYGVGSFVGGSVQNLAPSTCVSTIILWVTNKGNAPTVGPVVVTDALSPVMPKGSTVITTNGFCAFPGAQVGPTFVAGCANAGGAVAAGGWTCNVTQGNVACNRADALAAGATYPAITIRFTREDYSPGSAWDHVATVAGGGSASASVAGESVNFRQTGGEYVTIHSVPEGLPVMVDGQVVPTPHTEFWAYQSPHVIDAVYPNDGPLVGSGPWTTFLGFTTGNVTVVTPSSGGLATTLNVTANSFSTIEGVQDGPYGEISVRYAKP
jgi:hypothetical protein